MKAVIATKYGGPEVLKIVNIPIPDYGEDDILIKVNYSTVNVGDSRMRQFKVPPLFWLPGRLALGFTKLRNNILGMEAAGIVEKIGNNVKGIQIGDRIVVSTFKDKFGGHSEYKVVTKDSLHTKVPENIDLEQAVTLPVGGVTSLRFLKKAQIKPGQKILINGASGSLGTFAVQLAKIMGAEVTGVCGTKNVDLVKSIGADYVIDYTKEDFRNNGKVYDVIMDTVHKLNPIACKNSIKKNGSYIDVVSVMPSAEKLWIKFITGINFIGEQGYGAREDLDYLLKLVSNGKLKPIISQIFPLEEIADAHKVVDSGHKVGNIVIKI